MKDHCSDRHDGIDLLKFVAAFMVICIHVSMPQILREIIIPITRIAVPIFFMITGYYYNHVKSCDNEKRQICKIIKLCLGANLLYFVWSLFTCYVKSGSINEQLNEIFSFKSIANFLFFNESIVGSHLWYLGALLYVLIIVYVWERRWGREKLYKLIPLLLAVDLLFGKYSLLILGIEYPYIYVRNFLCVGLPYFLVGDILYRKKVNISAKILLPCTVLFVITTYGERYLLEAINCNAERDHYISTSLLTCSIFLVALNVHRVNKLKIKYICNIGARLSTGIYILHPIVIVVVEKIAEVMLGNQNVVKCVYEYIKPLIVFGGSIIMSWILCFFKKQCRAIIIRRHEKSRMC